MRHEICETRQRCDGILIHVRVPKAVGYAEISFETRAYGRQTRLLPVEHNESVLALGQNKCQCQKRMQTSGAVLTESADRRLRISSCKVRYNPTGYHDINMALCQ